MCLELIFKRKELPRQKKKKKKKKRPRLCKVKKTDFYSLKTKDFRKNFMTKFPCLAFSPCFSSHLTEWPSVVSFKCTRKHTNRLQYNVRTRVRSNP
jgi:hypothetical protein